MQYSPIYTITNTKRLPAVHGQRELIDIMEMNGTKKKKKTKLPTYILALRLLLKVGGLVLTVIVVNHWVIGVHVSHSNDMYPAVRDGDLCITYKLDRYLSEEVVAYKTKEGYRLGRIVALAGDTVDITEAGLFVNGISVSEMVVYDTPTSEAGVTFPYTVSEGAVFIFNDYRADTNDSRQFGEVSVEDLDGKAVLLLRRRGF